MAVQGFFWLCLSIVFLVMVVYTYRMRITVMPKAFEEAHKEEYFAGADIDKLKPIFNEMLTLELLAFGLTSISAFVEFLT